MRFRILLRRRVEDAHASRRATRVCAGSRVQGGRAERAARAGGRGARGERSGWEGSEREGGEGGEGGQSRVSMGVSGGTRANGTASCFLREKGSRERRRGAGVLRNALWNARARWQTPPRVGGRRTSGGHGEHVVYVRARSGRARDVCVWRAFGCVFSVKKLNQHRKYRAGIVCRRRSLVEKRRVQSQAISAFLFREPRFVFRVSSISQVSDREGRRGFQKSSALPIASSRPKRLARRWFVASAASPRARRASSRSPCSSPRSSPARTPRPRSGPPASLSVRCSRRADRTHRLPRTTTSPPRPTCSSCTRRGAATARSSRRSITKWASTSTRIPRSR